MFHCGSFLKLADDNKYIKNPEAQNRALSRTPEMDSNQSGAVGGIILGVF